MKPDLHQLLSDLGHDDGPDEQRRRREEELAAWAEHQLAARQAGGRPAGSAIKHRLLATLGSVDRFRPFFDRLREMLGLDDDGLRSALTLVDETDGWAGLPGLSFRDFAPGPGGSATEAGLIRIAAGTTFPRHTHLGRELGCVLEGVLLLEGRAYYPGDVVVSEAGSAHEFSAGPARDLVLVVAHSGIRFGE